MDITAISPDLTMQASAAAKPTDPAAKPDSTEVAKVSRQFESVLLRQFLSESMKPLLESGPSGQVYGYMLTDSLANTISEGGGLGLAHVLQTQLGSKIK